ncbi:MAG: DUF4168 domain-containing protein [Bacteroidia bacterium]
MNLKYFGSIIAGLLLMFGCQQETAENNNDQEVDDQTAMEHDPAEAPQDPEPFQQQQPEATEVSDEELQQFAEVVEHAQVINKEAQDEMVTAIESEMDVQRFSAIQQAEQDPTQQADATEEELQQYNVVSQEVEIIQAGAQQKMQEKIEEAGLEETRYQEIGMALQADTRLQERFRELQQQPN